MSCLTSEDHPSIGVMAPGQQCSGHGTCINVTATTFLCQCDPGFSGLAEWFDLRAENGLAFDCPTPDGLYIGMWTLNFTFMVLREIVLLLALFFQVFDGRRVGKRSTCKKSFLEARLTTKVLWFDAFVANPLLTYSTGDILFRRTVYGTDVYVTIILVFGTTFINLAFTTFSHATFRTLTKGALLNASDRTRLDKSHFRVSLAAGLSYSLFTGVPTFASLFLDKSQGPLVSKEFIIIIMRNVGMCVWLGFQALSSRWFLKQTRRMLVAFDTNSIETAAEHHHQKDIDKGAKRNAAVEVIAFLQENSSGVTRQASFGVVIWAIACIPQMWPYQGYFMCTMSAIASIFSNAGLILLRSRFRYRRAAAKKQPLSVSNNVQVTSSS